LGFSKEEEKWFLKIASVYDFVEKKRI